MQPCVCVRTYLLLLYILWIRPANQIWIWQLDPNVIVNRLLMKRYWRTSHIKYIPKANMSQNYLLGLPKYNIPYSGFISRGKTFVIWTSANASRLNFREYASCRAVTYTVWVGFILTTPIKISRFEINLRKSRNFSPSKQTRYTVYYNKSLIKGEEGYLIT